MATESSTAKKPTTRRKTTKRGPTKKTALAALKLTQEDLDLLASVKKARETNKNPVSTRLHTTTSPPGEYTSYNEGDEVGPNPEATTAPDVAQAFYVRNCRNIENNFRLERQQKQGVKRFELKPRGQRGDLAKLKEGDLEDDGLITNVHLGTIEIITAAEAKAILEKQSTNAQQSIHPAMASLRNELGESYAPENIRVDPEYNSQGVTVARLKPVGGEFGEIQFDRANRGSFTREPGVAPESQTNAQPVGNPHIISDGFARNDSAVQADAVARRKDLEGPEAGLGGITTVVVGTPERA